jgi:NAD(P)H-hydrate epimerase
LRAVVDGAEVPVVVDADALTLLGASAADVVRPTTILTPHDGEYERLMGTRPGGDRITAARDAAQRLGGIVLLKGRTTVVAAPDGEVLVCRLGDERLATLGSGDVLAGIIAALCAQGAPPLHAAALGAALHGLAARLGFRHGLTARDLVDHVPMALERVLES